MGMEWIGYPEIAAKLRDMPYKLRQRAIRRGVTKAARVVAKEAKARVPSKVTGLLKSSIGFRVGTMKRTGEVYAVVGPRRGYGQAFNNLESLKRRRAKIRKAVRGVEMNGANFRNPTRYAHLVEKGRKISDAARGGPATVLKTVEGRFIGKRAAAASPRPFLKPTMHATRDMYRLTVMREIQVEAAKGGFGYG